MRTQAGQMLSSAPYNLVALPRLTTLRPDFQGVETADKQSNKECDRHSL
ncbi:MAG TPA: hypothetical protein V6C65_38280 [Allocoleopsis sp.]